MGRPRKFDPQVAIAQAMETFRSNGYADTSPQDLVDRLGIGKGSLYNTFGSKHDLFLRSLKHYADTSMVDFKAVIEDDSPIRERVTRLLSSFVDADLEDPDRCGCLVVNTAVELGVRDDEAAQLVGRSLAATEAVLHTAFIAAQRAGEIAPERDPKALAGLVQSTMIGLRVLIKTTDDRDRLKSIIAATVAAI
ncbi:MAG: TetR/AcrR family transcriptional regulator [Actinomycetota bacterium]|nr:TetR/AcrR family transcriptional regulator [Actinomycetota bacterium]